MKALAKYAIMSEGLFANNFCYFRIERMLRHCDVLKIRLLTLLKLFKLLDL
ncbi:unnamed protein product [Moneuplotes crassus]|uniref:Uncharacterized protein n=1 Tax=Euplotes crassus TaxID=5936 RepID=A0AAD2DCJ8_EUPCR|nr:unnamed protein product [Moneuplotes crassus]